MFLKHSSFSLAYFDQTKKRDFLSCPDKIQINEKLWKKGQPDNSMGMQSCTIVNFKGKRENIGFDDIACLAPINAMCEVSIDQLASFFYEYNTYS
jgi:hypothetical protein